MGRVVFGPFRRVMQKKKTGRITILLTKHYKVQRYSFDNFYNDVHLKYPWVHHAFQYVGGPVEIPLFFSVWVDFDFYFNEPGKITGMQSKHTSDTIGIKRKIELSLESWRVEYDSGYVSQRFYLDWSAQIYGVYRYAQGTSYACIDVRPQYEPGAAYSGPWIDGEAVIIQKIEN